jgi:hypothetical protein
MIKKGCLGSLFYFSSKGTKHVDVYSDASDEPIRTAVAATLAVDAR